VRADNRATILAAYDAGHRTITAVARETGLDRGTVRWWWHHLKLVTERNSRPSLRALVGRYRAEGLSWSRIAMMTQVNKPTLWRLALEWGMLWDEPVPGAVKAPRPAGTSARRCQRCLAIYVEAHECQPRADTSWFGVIKEVAR
jgi:hypothetical protein